MKKLIQQIEQWAEDRNLIKGSTPQKQMLKLMEEFGELCGGIAKNKPEVIKDSIGDCFVVLTILNAQYRLSPIGNNHYQQHLLEPTGHFGAKNLDEVVLRSIAQIGKICDPTIRSMDWDVNALANYLSLISKMAGLDFKDCVQHAYDQIKDRKGVMREGIWIKSEDLDG